MSRFKFMQPVPTFSMAVGAIAVAVCLTAGAQTTTTTTTVKPPVKKVATPVPAAKTTTPATTKTASQKTQTATPVVTPASSQTAAAPSTPTSTAVPANTVNGLTSTGSTVAPSNMVNGLTSTGSNALSNTVNGLSSTGTNAVSGLTSAGTNAVNGMVPGSTAAAGQNSMNGVPAGDPRAPVGGLGVGSFVYAGWTLTAYGCFRTGTRLFCDFDTSYISNFQAATNIWGPVNLVDDGGKITLRHNAFFVGDDGTPFVVAYLTANKPVRFIIEYDDVGQRYTSISLVCGKDQIQAVPITIMDPNQAAGTMPARASRGATR